MNLMNIVFDPSNCPEQRRMDSQWQATTNARKVLMLLMKVLVVMMRMACSV